MNGEHSCEETALGFDSDGPVSAVNGSSCAADKTDEAMLARVLAVAPFSCAVVTSPPSYDP